MPDVDDAQIKQQRAQFIKAFTDISEACANMAAVGKKQIEVTNKQIEMASALFDAVMAPNDGVRDAVDDLIDEVRGLRDDLRILVKAGGLQSALAALIGKKQRGV